MNSKYNKYAQSRLAGNFGAMSSFRFVFPYLKGKRVLDIGCSDGLYLQRLASESVGIEQVYELATSCKQKGLNVINSDVMAAISSFSDNSFEAVLFSHVMEHLESPILMLKQIHRALVPKGVLILGLPIERNIFRDVLRMDYFDGTHIYAFSVRNSIKLLNETGFEKKKIYFHLPKCRNYIGHKIESVWNEVKWPLREYLSMAYWIVAEKI